MRQLNMLIFLNHGKHGNTWKWGEKVRGEKVRGKAFRVIPCIQWFDLINCRSNKIPPGYRIYGNTVKQSACQNGGAVGRVTLR